MLVVHKCYEMHLLGIQCKSCICLYSTWILQESISEFVKQYFLDGVLSGKKELGFDQCICRGSVGGTSRMVCAGPPCSERLEKPYPTVSAEP